VRVLPDWHFGSAPVTLLVPTRKGRTARVQALVDFLLQCSSDGML
jgi:DNA-binding transcriptional LysR family regulator